MAERLPESLLARLSTVIGAKTGLHFPPTHWRELERGIAAAAGDLGCADLTDCVQWLVSANLSKEQIGTLACHLTVGETYFFREEPILRAVEQHVLPELIRARTPERRLRIWSAGCCSGEEPYSLAILLTRVLPEWREWDRDVRRHTDRCEDRSGHSCPV